MAGILDGAAARRAVELYAEALRRHRAELDSLNVYPVPDGDTGTNLSLTMDRAASAVAALEADATLGQAGAAAAGGALLGARGNSGVIVSEVLRALFDALPPDRAPGPGEVASALLGASEAARRAVERPVDGTILSVLRDAAGAARRAADGLPAADALPPAGAGAGVAAVLDAALEEARRSLARTREQLPELRSAGVVDAGAKGLVLLLDALGAAVAGREMTEPEGPPGPVGHGRPGSEEDGHGPAFEVQYVLEPGSGESEGAVEALRRALARIGDSLVVARGEGVYRVHVHTDEPGAAVELALEAGRPRSISITHLPSAHHEPEVDRPREAGQEVACALVAVAEGEGLAATFRSLGAVVVPGGPGNNPAVADILAAVDGAGVPEVLILPNHRNVVPAAERAAAGASRRAGLVRTTSIPAGLAAAAAFNPARSLGANVEAGAVAAAASRAGEVLRAERDATTPQGPVRAGRWLGMSEGELVAQGEDPAEVAVALAERLGADQAEILTVVAGAASTPAEASEVASALRGRFARAEVEVLDGGQPRHPYLIGVE
jgi:uncharacterized protein